MSSWPSGISAITAFVEDLDDAKRFYGEVFGLPVIYEDADSAVFNFGNTIINLLKTTAAHSLIEPAQVASRDAGARPSVHDRGRRRGRDVRGAHVTRRGAAERADGSPMGNPNRELPRSRRPHLGDREVGQASSAGAAAYSSSVT